MLWNTRLFSHIVKEKRDFHLTCESENMTAYSFTLLHFKTYLFSRYNNMKVHNVYILIDLSLKLLFQEHFLIFSEGSRENNCVMK